MADCLIRLERGVSHGRGSRRSDWTSDAYVARHVEAQLLQLISQASLGNAVQLVEGEVGVGAAEGDAMALRCEDGVVKVLLSRCKGT